jgi:probable phosphoglycerate mutase
MPINTATRLWLIRHGETEWSLGGRHTGLTDIPLTKNGEEQARQLRERLRGHEFSLVMTSPLRRARDTCALVGLTRTAIVDPDLSEWNYGGYEGLTSAEIRAENPGWTIWHNGVPAGETVEDVRARVDRAMARAVDTTGDAAIFAHGHYLRAFAARWLGLGIAAGGLFALDTASVSILGYEHGRRAVRHWNDISHLS